MAEHTEEKEQVFFKLERDAAAYFDDHINEKFFIIDREVRGRRIFDARPVCPDSDRQNLRIDRILHPTKEAFKIGWKWGAIGVELKKSDVTLARGFAQIFEQQQSVFSSKKLWYTRIMPQVFALFPSDNPGYDLHSFAASFSILFCHPEKDEIVFSDGNYKPLTISKTEIYVNKKWKPNTTKGHR